MSKIIIGFIVFVLFVGCQQKQRNIYEGLKVSDLRDTTTFSIDKKNVISIKIPHPIKKKIKTSEIIEDFKYIPIETSSNSLLGQYSSVYIYDNNIFIKDFESQMIHIFDLDGKYINKVGKKGNGPQEFIQVSTMAIDPFNKHLVVYDQIQHKLFHFTINGNYLYTKKVPLIFDEDISFISPNRIVFAKSKTIDNPQLKELNECRLIYTDSTLNIMGGTFTYDNNYIDTYAPHSFSINKTNTLFYPTYLNDYYEISENSLTQKYHFDYSEFDNSLDINKLSSLNKEDDRFKYLFSTTRALPGILFTDNFLWFKTQMKNWQDEFYSYYDKTTNNIVSFKQSDLDPDIDLIFTSAISTYEDYIIGYITAQELIDLKNFKEKNGIKISSETVNIINNLQSDDNALLVLFKLKSIK